MKLGIHAYAWCSQWSNNTLNLIDRTQKLGMDFIEIPLMVLETFDSLKVRKRLNSNSFLAVTSTVLLGDTDITSENEIVRKNGINYLMKCIQATHEIGATCFSGVIYSQHVKPTQLMPTEQTWQYSADALREVARYAKQYGVTIGIEPVNRYETYFINTCEQAKTLINMVGENNVKIHLDSYHMNIEEKSFYDATILAGADLIHYHLCENDRGIPGSGLINWDDIFRALAEINYDGYAALESFVELTNNMNTWVWRRLAPDGDTLLREGVKFIRKKMAKFNLIS